MHRRSAGFFGLLTLVFFAPLLWGETFLPVGFLYRTPLWYNPAVPLKFFDLFDAVVAFYPYQELLKNSLAQGEFPFWNPYNFAGHPIAFNGQSGFFYPPRLVLLWLLPAWLAHGLSLALHTFLAGFATWCLARRLKCSPLAAGVGGVAWMFNPFVMSWLEIDILNICAAWTPICLLGVLRCAEDRRAIAWLGLSMSMLVLAGHLQFVLYAVATIVIVGLLLLWHDRAPSIVWPRLMGSAALATLLSAPMLIPTAFYLSHSQRPKLSYEFLTSIHQQFLKTSWSTFLMPEALGNGNDFAFTRIFGAGEFIFPELCLYFGIVTLTLAMTTSFEKGLGRWLVALAVLILIAPSTPLFHLVHWLPGLNKINSTRSLQMVHFLVALASAFGVDALDSKRLKKSAMVLAGLFFGTALAWAIWAIGRSPGETLKAGLSKGAIRLPKAELFLSQESYLEALRQGYLDVYSWQNPSIWIPLACILGCFLTLAFSKNPKPWVLGWVALDLLVFGAKLNPHHPHRLLFPMNKSLEKLQTAGLERVMGLGSIKPNTLQPFAIPDMAGYDSFYPRPSSEYLAYIMRGEHQPEKKLPAQVFPVKRYQTPLVDLMGVKFLLGYPGQKLDDKPLVQTQPLSIFENPSRLPRTFLVGRFRVEPDTGSALELLDSGTVAPSREAILISDPGIPLSKRVSGEAKIVSYGHNHAIVETKCSEPSLLILTDGYVDGWEATVDGKSSPILRADVMFRAVVLPKGDHLVEFSFRPVGFPVSCFMAGLGLLAVLGLLVLGRKQSS